MMLYKIIRDGRITNQWYSNYADETYYETCFGKPERWVTEDQEDVSEALETRVNEETEQTEYRLAAEYELEIVDLDEEKELNPDWIALRATRDNLLAACDFTQLADAPFTTEEKAAWAAYRQELRDLPQNTEDPTSPQWPVKPS